MFSRRDMLAVSAAGAVMTASAAHAASFGNPDQPPQGAVNAKAPGTLKDPGPQSEAIGNQFPSAQFPPATDVGGMPMDWASFNNAPKRVQNGGWARQVTQKDFAISDTIPGVKMRLADGRRHKGIALASGRRVGDHDLRQLPRNGSRRFGPAIRCRRQ